MKLPRTRGEKVIRALMAHGFQEIRIRGSHHYLVNPDSDTIVTVPVHSGKILAPKTLQSILQSSGLSLDDVQDFL